MFSRFSRLVTGPLRSPHTPRVSRHFLGSKPSYIDVHSEIMDILRSELSQPMEPFQAKKKKNILILSPDKTKNTDYVKYVESVAKKRRRKASPGSAPSLGELDLLQEAAKTPEKDVEAGLKEKIESFRPGAHTQAAGSRLKLVVLALASAFTRAQLAHYVQQYGRQFYRKKHKKDQLAETIVTHIWQARGSALDSVFGRETVPLSRQQMFLLLSQRGQLLRVLKSTVASLDFDTRRQELVLVGTASQIQNAQINLAHRFELAVREEIDLSTLQKLYTEKFGAFTFAEIGKLIEVYFEHISGDRYELCAASRAQVKRIQRLLVWFLDYNLHRAQRLHLPEPEVLSRCSMLPVADDYSMAWPLRSKAHFLLEDETRITDKYTLLTREMEAFSDESLADSVAHADYDVSPDYFAQKTPFDETYEALQASGILDDDTLEHVIDDIIDKLREMKRAEGEDQEEREERAFVETSGSRVPESSQNLPDSVPLLSSEQKSRLYQELVDFSYRKTLNGVEDSRLDLPLFTVTLGRVLFSVPKPSRGVLAVPPEIEGNDGRDGKDGKDHESGSPSSLSDSFSFTTNIPLVYDQVLRQGLGPMGVDSDSNTDSSSFDDPHAYNLQFKFLPSPYVELEDSATLHDHMKYPPVEMWMQLNENKVVDIESLQLVTVEGENDSYVCLPGYASDLKVTCQMTGRVLSEGGEGDESGESGKSGEPENEGLSPNPGPTPHSASLEGLFDATSSKYPRLAAQKGVQAFLESLSLNFSGKQATSIAPFVDISINGKPVRYSFVSLNYRRELDVDLDENHMAQVSVVDGGLLGGRRVEVRFIGDFNAGLDRKAFDDLLDKACAFVKHL